MGAACYGASATALFKGNDLAGIGGGDSAYRRASSSRAREDRKIVIDAMRHGEGHPAGRMWAWRGLDDTPASREIGGESRGEVDGRRADGQPAESSDGPGRVVLVGFKPVPANSARITSHTMTTTIDHRQAHADEHHVVYAAGDTREQLGSRETALRDTTAVLHAERTSRAKARRAGVPRRTKGRVVRGPRAWRPHVRTGPDGRSRGRADGRVLCHREGRGGVTQRDGSGSSVS